METGTASAAPPRLSAEDVIAYLHAHPDFLAQHADLIESQTPPRLNRGGGVVDLQYFMIERLRGELMELRASQDALVAISRANLSNQARVHAATLALMEARSFERLIETVTTELSVLLDLDVAALVIESNGEELPHVHRTGVRVAAPGIVDQLLGPNPVRLDADIDGDPEIYGPAAGLVRSQALVKLHVSSETPAGLLAFGSRDPQMFHPGQGTELILFLARVVERAIVAWLDLPA